MCLEGGGQKKILCWCEIFMKFQLRCPHNVSSPFGDWNPGMPLIWFCLQLPWTTGAEQTSRPADQRRFAAAEAKLTSPKCLLFASFLGMFANLWAKTKLVFKWVLWRRGQESKGAEGAVWVKQPSLCQLHTMHFCWKAKLIQDLYNGLKSAFSLVISTWPWHGGL